jgi:hypothetical protein
MHMFWFITYNVQDMRVLMCVWGGGYHWNSFIVWTTVLTLCLSVYACVWLYHFNKLVTMLDIFVNCEIDIVMNNHEIILCSHRSKRAHVW